MNLLSIVSDLFKPAADLIDNLHTSEDEKLQAKATMLEVQTAFLSQALIFEQERLKARAEIITAEAKSNNLLTSSWRPVTMYAFLLMLLSWWWGWTEAPPNATPEVLTEIFGLLKIGIGGYIGSRGVEKVAPAVIKSFKSKEES